MRDPARITIILDKLKQVWEKYPDARFGQLLWSVGAAESADDRLYYLEDEEFENLLDKALKK